LPIRWKRTKLCWVSWRAGLSMAPITSNRYPFAAAQTRERSSPDKYGTAAIPSAYFHDIHCSPPNLFHPIGRRKFGPISTIQTICKNSNAEPLADNQALPDDGRSTHVLKSA